MANVADTDRSDSAAEATPWWHSAVVYQIYPRSFADANLDGVGDLAGIRSRLDHLQWLGVDAIWLSPVFTSPMADFGYDVSDYCDIDPVFGNLADMDALIADCHGRGIKVLLDWVPNHTSDQHPWFVESSADRDNAKADWYIWRDEPTNNWLASLNTGQSAWQWHEGRGQYYLRLFLEQQPDLNWDVPEVEAAMLETLRFWLDRGVDGFRMDVIHLIGKSLDQDDPPAAVERGHGHVPYNDVPVTHERLRRIRATLDAYDGDRVSVGEVYLLDEAKMAAYHGDGDELHLSFNFSFLWQPWDAARLRAKIASTVAVLAEHRAWPTWVLSNHDVPRHRQRYGGSEAAARVAAVMLLTLPGTPFLYQGEEFGLVDADVPADRVVDPGGRDGCRAPMPWTADAGHGWPQDPWLPFAPDVDRRNAGSLQQDPDSILHLYRAMLQARRQHSMLAFAGLGPDEFRLLDLGADLAADVIAYERTDTSGTALIVLNLGHDPVEIDRLYGATLLVSTTPHVPNTLATAVVPGASAVVVRLP